MRSSRAAVVAVVAALAGIIVAGMIAAVGTLVSPASASAEPLYLEAAHEVGDNPFVPAAGPKVPVVPDAPGCDPAALVATLQADPRLAGAWTDALNSDPTLSWSGGSKVRPDQIRAYIGELIPQVLPQDLRVTNFRYTRGAAEPVQSVLQAGTSVLVDRAGVVRVRCKCGNPLTPMHELTAKPAYQGTPWKGFVEDEVVKPHCDDDEYLDDGECHDKRCPDGEHRDDDGDCRPEPCRDGEHRDDDGHCRPEPCRDGDHRDDDGHGSGEHHDGRDCHPTPCEVGEPHGDGHQDGRDHEGDCRTEPCPDDREARGDCQHDPCAGPDRGVDCPPPACPDDLRPVGQDPAAQGPEAACALPCPDQDQGCTERRSATLTDDAAPVAAGTTGTPETTTTPPTTTTTPPTSTTTPPASTTSQPRTTTSSHASTTTRSTTTSTSTRHGSGH